jgi:cytochrome c-type biogenesis protein
VTDVPFAAQPDMSSWTAPVIAFAAGVMSFASPCVLPLVPGYVAFVIGGRGSNRQRCRARLLPILAFIAGFTIVFTLLGAASGTFVPLVRGRIGQLAAGGYLCLVGLAMMAAAMERGPIRLRAEHRPFLSRARPGILGALPLGMAFAAGWTPCIGPVLGAILALAALGGTGRGALLLAVYSVGLGLPFLLIGLGLQHGLAALTWIRRRYMWLTGASGIAMLAIGALTATGKWGEIVAPLARGAWSP